MDSKDTRKQDGTDSEKDRTAKREGRNNKRNLILWAEQGIYGAFEKFVCL
jgi:hypothetical protein